MSINATPGKAPYPVTDYLKPNAQEHLASFLTNCVTATALPCSIPVHVGLFFDGTNNHMERDRNGKREPVPWTDNELRQAKTKARKACRDPNEVKGPPPIPNLPMVPESTTKGVPVMKWFFILLSVLSLSACAGLDNETDSAEPTTAPAQVGVVNHTGNYIYSASVNGAGGGKMSAWSAGGAAICCASIPRIWYPGMKVRVRWNMPIGRKDVIKEKIVEVEKYEEPGDIYLHFFPNDQIRVIITNIGGPSSEHPIPPPVKPVNAQ